VKRLLKMERVSNAILCHKTKKRKKKILATEKVCHSNTAVLSVDPGLWCTGGVELKKHWTLHDNREFLGIKGRNVVVVNCRERGKKETGTFCRQGLEFFQMKRGPESFVKEKFPHK